MGWERKRGKLERAQPILRRDRRSRRLRRVHVGDAARLPQHPLRHRARRRHRSAARRGPPARRRRSAHPLNRAGLDAATRPRGGRLHRAPAARRDRACSAGSRRASRRSSRRRTASTRTRAPSPTSTRTSSAKGIFVGKGIYDVAAFEPQPRGGVPDNALLSHDLFEGLHGPRRPGDRHRAVRGLPRAATSPTRAAHRWVRGDWQLLPWLGRAVPVGRAERRNRLPALGRWKILDNLRRSLVPPALCCLLAARLAGPAGQSAWPWTASPLPRLADPPRHRCRRPALRRRARSRRPPRGSASVATAAGAGCCGVVFLAHRGGDRLSTPIARTLCAPLRHAPAPAAMDDRRRTSRRAGAQRLRAGHSGARWRSRRRGARPRRAAARAGSHPARCRPPLPAARCCGSPRRRSPCWLSRPRAADARRRCRGRRAVPAPARAPHLVVLRDLRRPGGPVAAARQLPGGAARRGGAPHLADQHRPAARLHARRADLGYVGVLTWRTRTREHPRHARPLERYRGHLLNWYDTRRPGAARAALRLDRRQRQPRGLPVVVKEAALRRPSAPVHARGARGTASPTRFAELGEVRSAARGSASAGERLARCSDRCVAACAAPRAPGARASIALAKPRGPGASQSAVGTGGRSRPDRRRVAGGAPGHPGLARAPQPAPRWRCGATFDAPDCHGWRAARRRRRPRRRRIAAASDARTRSRADLAAATNEPRQRPSARWPLIGERGAAPVAAAPNGSPTWRAAIEAGGASAGAAACRLLADRRGTRPRRWRSRMDFGFLYDRERRLFHIGYNVSAARIDEHHYDLLASEARLASFFAIAKGDVPRRALVPSRPADRPRWRARARCCRGAARCSST